MPFTISHAAAALPFRRARLVTSALVIGTFAPDLEYFIRLNSGGGWGHTLLGALAMDLPVGLATLWIFHHLVKIPLVALLPDSVRARLTSQLATFRFGPLPRFLLIVLSLLIGIATHLVWDGFTHPQYWIVRHWKLLSHVHHYPLIGWETNFSLLQVVSSAGGLLVLAIWGLLWYRRTASHPAAPPSPFTPAQRKAVFAAGCAFAVLGSLGRAWLGLGVPNSDFLVEAFLQEFVVTFCALCWWQLAMWGFFGLSRLPRPVRHYHPQHHDARATIRQ